MNLVSADSHSPSCSTKPQSYRERARAGTGRCPEGTLVPESRGHGGGTGPGQVPGAAAAALGPQPREPLHGRRRHREWGERSHTVPRTPKWAHRSTLPRVPGIPECPWRPAQGSEEGRPPGAEDRVQSSGWGWGVGLLPRGPRLVQAVGSIQDAGARQTRDANRRSAAFKGKCFVSRPWAHV